MSAPIGPSSLHGRVVIGVVLALAVASCATGPRGGLATTVWVGSWTAAPQLVEPANLPPAPGLAGRTLRQVVHLSIGGARLRIRFSNEFGNGDLRIGAVHIAASGGRDSIIGSTDQVVTFAGDSTVLVHAGDAVLSDPIDLPSRPLADLALSTYILTCPSNLTGHPGSRTTSFVATGDHTSATSLQGAATTQHWYLASRIDVLAPMGSAALVVLGNSIADGRGSGTDRNTRWPDDLARRLASDERTAHVAVVNAGIGGNAVVRGGLGPTALARFDRDVLSQPGVRWVLVSEGVNDIGTSRTDSSAAVAGELIAAFRDLATRAHARGLRVYMATIMPFGRSFYDNPQHEAARQTVNRWVRTADSFDAVIDFDAAMRDPEEPSRLLPAADGGDHLHPNELGYRLMANAVDLGLFRAP
jgi:lysophospholipase L1-like esterase